MTDVEQIYRKGAIDALSALTVLIETQYNNTGDLRATHIITFMKQTLTKFREAPINELTWKQQNKSH